MIRAEKSLIENESYPIMIAANLVVDASNKTCPLPVLYAKKALQTLSVNDTLLIICTDLKAEDDLKNFCKKKGHLYVSGELKDDKLFIIVKKC